MSESNGEKLACVLVILILSIPLAIYNGYVITILWDWFIVPFFSLPQLTIPMAIGIQLVICYLFGTDRMHTKLEKTIDKIDDSWIKASILFLAQTLRSSIALLIGWIVKAFI